MDIQRELDRIMTCDAFVHENWSKYDRGLWSDELKANPMTSMQGIFKDFMVSADVELAAACHDCYEH